MGVCVGIQQSSQGSQSQSGCTATEDDEEGEEADDVYRVLVLGGPGVGKTAIAQQFLTSEYMAAQNTSFGQFRVHVLCTTFASAPTSVRQWWRVPQELPHEELDLVCTFVLGKINKNCCHQSCTL